MVFPTTRYHRTEKPCRVENEEELAALGEGWVDTPAVFLNEPEPAPTPKPDPPKPKRKALTRKRKARNASGE